MSNVSTGFDAFVTRIETVLDTVNQGYSRIPNPYSVQDNTEHKLRKGYGVAFLSGVNTNRQINCKFSVSRNLDVVLTRLYTGKEENAVSISSVEKLLMEDQYKLINNLEQDVSVNGSSMYTRFISDGGIEFVSGDSGRFLMIRTQFSFEYLENFV